MKDAIRCDGSSACEAPLHLHGCFADAGNCDMPDEHAIKQERYDAQDNRRLHGC